MAAEVFVELRAIITEFQAKMAEARGEMAKTQKEGSSSFQALGKASSVAMSGLAAAAVAGVTLAVKAGSELQESNRKLKVAIEDSGAKYETFAPQIAKADKAMENFGFTNVQTEEALSVGVTATNSTAKALQYLQVAADLAKYKNMSLADAMTLVVKGAEGQLRPLRALGIDLPVMTGNAQQVAAAQTKLAAAQANLNSILSTQSPQAAELYKVAVEKTRLAEEKLNTAQTNLHDLLHKFPTAANPASAAHAKYEAAIQAVQSAQIAVQTSQASETSILQKYGPAADAGSASHAKYEAALKKVDAAQAALTAKMGSGKTMLDTLAARLKGQAADSASTFSGQMQVAKAKVEDAAAKIGLLLIPWIERMVGWLSTAVGWLQKHKAAAEALAAVIAGVLATAIAVFTVNKVASLVNSIRGAIGWFQKLGSTAKTEGAEVEASSTGMSGKFTGALGVMAAGVAAFQVTTALLKSNFLGIGNAVTGVAKSISDFFGGIGQVKPSTSLTSQTVAFLEAIASGRQQAANLTPAQAAADLHAAGVPGFATGGVVPGTRGAPMLAVVHGGETITPAGGGGGGDLVIRINGQEFARVAGPDLRNWLITQPGRSATRIL